MAFWLLLSCDPMDSPYWSSCSRVLAGSRPGRWVGKGSLVGLRRAGGGRGDVNRLMVCLQWLSVSLQSDRGRGLIWNHRCAWLRNFKQKKQAESFKLWEGHAMDWLDLMIRTWMDNPPQHFSLAFLNHRAHSGLYIQTNPRGRKTHDSWRTSQ